MTDVDSNYVPLGVVERFDGFLAEKDCAMAVGLEIYSDVKLLCFVMKMLDASFGEFNRYFLTKTRVFRLCPASPGDVAVPTNTSFT